MPRLRALLLPVLLLGVQPPLPARAADVAILGSDLVVANRRGDETHRTVTVSARDTSTGIAAVSDPRAGGATLTVVANGGTSSEETFLLDAAGWRALGKNGYAYKGPTGADGDPVASVKLVRRKNGLVSLRARLAGRRGTQPLDVVPPNPGTDGGAILDVAGGDRYCVRLGGPAGGLVRKDTDRRWRIVHATATAGCPSGPTTTTTTTSTTTTPTTTTTTTTGAPVCGNGVVEAGEECDGNFCDPSIPAGCGSPSGAFPCQCCLLPGATAIDVPFPVPCCNGGVCIDVGPHACICPEHPELLCGNQEYPTCNGECLDGGPCVAVPSGLPGSGTGYCICYYDLVQEFCGRIIICPTGYRLDFNTCTCVPA